MEKLPLKKKRSLSEEHRRKIAESNRRRGCSLETRRRMSEALKGRMGLSGSKNGMYGKTHSEETKRKIGIASTGRVVSEETRRKLSDINRGEGNPMYGKVPSEEHRRKISKSNKGKTHPCSEGTKMKISEVNKGRRFSKETKRRMSESHKGKGLGSDNPMFGKEQSDFQKQQVSKANTGKETSQKTRNLMSKNNGMHSRKAKRKQKENSKRLWQDPEYQRKVAAGLKLSPNKPEQLLMKLLDKTYPNEWKYVGDFQFFLGGKNPDFINVNSKKFLIELFGDYWHQGQDPQDRINHFKQYGFDTLVIWESELENLEKIKNKLDNFGGRENGD